MTLRYLTGGTNEDGLETGLRAGMLVIHRREGPRVCLKAKNYGKTSGPFVSGLRIQDW